MQTSGAWSVSGSRGSVWIRGSEAPILGLNGSGWDRGSEGDEYRPSRSEPMLPDQSRSFPIRADPSRSGPILPEPRPLISRNSPSLAREPPAHCARHAGSRVPASTQHLPAPTTGTRKLHATLDSNSQVSVCFGQSNEISTQKSVCHVKSVGQTFSGFVNQVFRV